MTKMHFNKTRKMLSVKVLIILTCLLICVSQNSCNHSAAVRKGVVSILDTRNSEESEENLASHKQFDVAVYRILFMGNGYTVRYFQKENNTLRDHSATYMTEDVFNKAVYSWLTDTSISIRLYNTASKKEKVLKVYGYGPRSSISD